MIDTVNALEQGDFHLDAIWRVLGNVDVEENVLNLEQDGERFHIVNADGSGKSLADREADFAPDWEANWKNYEHADGTVRMWHQKQRLTLDAGEQAAFVNLLYPSNADMDQAFDLERVGPSVAQVRDRRSGESHMAGVGAYESGELRVDAELFRIDGNGFSLVEGTSLAWDGPLFRSWAPVSVELDLARGEGIVEARAETRVGVRAESVHVDGERMTGGGEGKLLWFTLSAGRHRLQVSPSGEAVFDQVLRDAAALAMSGAVSVRLRRPVRAPGWLRCGP